MHALINAAFSRSRSVTLILLLVIGMGVVAYQNIPKEAEPDVNIPVIYVSMAYEGISPEDAERLLIRPMERELSTIEGINEIKGTATEGFASVQLEFTAGGDGLTPLSTITVTGSSGAERTFQFVPSGGSGDPRAWPWTSNIRGRGHYYDSKGHALKHLETVAASGERSFDVGCMQLNYRWHGARFDTLAQMIDPAQNVDYAARYLRELRDETGDWDKATRYYHSRDPSRGEAYLGRVRRALARLGSSSKPQPIPERGTAQLETSIGTPSDRRFRPGDPLIRLSSKSRYWQHPGLPEGAMPRLPRGPFTQREKIKR